MKKDSLKSKKLLLVSLILLVCTACAVSIVLFSQQDFDVFANSFKDCTNYYIHGELDTATHTLTCTQKVEYKNATNNNLNKLEFHLYPNNFSSSSINKPISQLYETSAYPNGKSYGYITIKSVKSNGNGLEYDYKGDDKDILVVNCPSIKKGSYYNIEIEYLVKIPNVNHRFGYGENTINVCNFYPIACVFEDNSFVEDYYTSSGDPFFSDMANYFVKITYPASFVLASSGNVINTTTQEQKNTTQIEGKGIRDFGMVFCDKYNKLSYSNGNTTINYFYYNDTNPQESLQTCKKSLETFENLIGEYSYRTLNVCESNFVYGGMEYPNLVLISDNLDKYEDYTNTIIHEIGHQWFFGMVGNNQYKYGWLDEGLTEYITNYFYKINPEYNISYDDVIQNAQSAYSLFVQIYSSIYGEVDTSMNRKLNEYSTEPEYVYMAYVKGMLLFDNINSILGEKTFNKCLKKYFELYKGKVASPDDLIYVFEKYSHKKLKAIFYSWIDGKVEVIDID